MIPRIVTESSAKIQISLIVSHILAPLNNNPPTPKLMSIGGLLLERNTKIRKKFVISNRNFFLIIDWISFIIFNSF